MAASSIVDSGLCLKKEPIKILHRESIKESQSSLFSFYGPLFFFRIHVAPPCGDSPRVCALLEV